MKSEYRYKLDEAAQISEVSTVSSWLQFIIRAVAIGLILSVITSLYAQPAYADSDDSVVAADTNKTVPAPSDTPTSAPETVSPEEMPEAVIAEPTASNDELVTTESTLDKVTEPNTQPSQTAESIQQTTEIVDETEPTNVQEGGNTSTFGESVDDQTADETAAAVADAAPTAASNANRATTTNLRTNNTTNAAEDSVNDSAEPIVSARPETQTATDTAAVSVNEFPSVDIATSTDTEIDQDMTFVQQSSNELRFDPQRCVETGGGTFFCQVGTTEPTIADTVFAEIDTEGDTEIVLYLDEERTQITFNSYDDQAPHYDPLSNTVVWQRLQQDRYQIVAYDIANNTETYLTSDRVNNLSPSRAGAYTVWQRWSGVGWEIVLARDGTTEVISQSNTDNIAPDITGDLVVWTHLSSDVQRSIATYNINTKQLTYIDDPTGAMVENPRVALVYNTVENGDRITRAVDIATGEQIALGAQPALPARELPNPDPVGQPLALTGSTMEQDLEIQEKEVQGTDDTTSTSTPEIDTSDPVTSSPASTSSPSTLDLRVAQPASTTTVTTEYELDLSASTSVSLAADDSAVKSPIDQASSTQRTPTH